MAVGLPDSTQSRATDDDLVEMGFAGEQLIDAHVAGQEQFVNREHGLRAAAITRLGEREIIEVHAAALLEAGGTDLDG